MLAGFERRRPIPIKRRDYSIAEGIDRARGNY
jgi:hypothetical protein